jgi:hypothetical protein
MSKRNKTESAPVVVTESAPVKSAAHVQMVRDTERYPAPHEVRVNVLEIENYKVGGWVLK